MRAIYKLFMVLAMLCGVACTTNTLEESVVENNAVSRELPNEISVSFDDATSRIQLDEQCRTTWTEDDEVSVFYFSDANNRFLFMGDTGDRNGALVVEDNRMSDATAEIDKVVLVYPYSDDYKLNATTKSIGITIPGTQYYLNGSYGVGANIMTSVGTTNDFALKSVCGWIKVQLTGAASVTEVTLTGNNKEQLAGDATLYYEENRLALLGEEGGPDDDSQVGGTLFFGEYVRTITLDCGEGIALDSTTPTEFYFVLAPQTFDEGITIKATLSDGTTITKSTSKSISIQRNVITPMASFDVQPTNEIWYTSTDGNIVEPHLEGVEIFGANIVSNTYENGKGVITFDGDVTKIGYQAFSGCSSLASITIPTTITDQIAPAAFAECENLSRFIGHCASEDGRCLISEYQGDLELVAFAPEGLTEYTIPNNVTAIGYAAFATSKLETINIPDNVTKISEYAFAECFNLKSITLPQSITKIESATFMVCTSLTEITIQGHLTSVGIAGTFAQCPNLTRFIAEQASEDKRCLIVDGVLVGFAQAGITGYEIPSDVTIIGENVFSLCQSISKITIPESVVEIRGNAFRDCTALSEIYCRSITPPLGDGSMFSIWSGNVPYRKIYVPTESIEAYKEADGWSEYADDIEGYEFLPANNEIWYTSTDGNIVEPSSSAFGVNIVSNTYENGKGVIKFDGEVTEIGYAAFSGCSSLASITIPESVTSIGELAFTDCSSLTSITIPDSVTSIGNVAFSGCSSLTSITIPDGVTSIGEWAFYDCSSLASITIPDSVTEIGEYTFTACSSLAEFSGKFASEDGRCLVVDGVINSFAIGCGLTEYTIPEGVTSIGVDAFLGCSSLASITIPESVTSIGCDAFYNCSSLASITIPDSVTSIGEFAFAYCSSLTSFTIPDGVTSIGEGAFAHCSSLTSITIPDSVNEIGDLAFYDCSSLASITIPEGVTSIGVNAFSGCSSLTSITIPDSVTSIGDSAFEICYSLTSVYCKATTPPTAIPDSSSRWDAFDYNASGRKIYVPTESVEAYKNASYWSNYADAIEPYVFE